jgi:NAD(P) transhydrogenase
MLRPKRPDGDVGRAAETGWQRSRGPRRRAPFRSTASTMALSGATGLSVDEITVTDLSARTQHVIAREIDVIRNQLARNHVALLVGTARFTDPHAVEVTDDAEHHQQITADKIVIAVGTKPARPATVAFDGKTIVDSDQVLNMDKVPASMVVVGAGVIGIEYAIHVRRPGHQGHRGGKNETPCSTSATPRSSRPCNTNSAIWRSPSDSPKPCTRWNDTPAGP